MAEENSSRENLSRVPSRESREKKTTLDKIEKLIVDGQKEVLEKVGKVEERLGGVEEKLGKAEERLDKKISAVHASLKNEIKVTAFVLKDELGKKIDQKLEEHMRIPA